MNALYVKMNINFWTNQFHYAFSDYVCFFDYLPNQVLYSQGNTVGPTLNKNLYDCQKECDNNQNCNNIKYCGKNQAYKFCTLYDKVITRDEDQVDLGDDCLVSFKTCASGGGNWFNLIIASLKINLDHWIHYLISK